MAATVTERVDWLTAKDIAIQMNVHEMTVRRWIWRGRLKAVQVGGLVRVRPADLQAFMRTHPGRG